MSQESSISHIFQFFLTEILSSQCEQKVTSTRQMWNWSDQYPLKCTYALIMTYQSQENNLGCAQWPSLTVWRKWQDKVVRISHNFILWFLSNNVRDGDCLKNGFWLQVIKWLFCFKMVTDRVSKLLVCY